MKNYFIILLLITVSIVNAFSQKRSKEITFKTKIDTISYIIGMDIGNNLKRQEIKVNPDVLNHGLKDALAGRPSILTEEQVRTVMMAFQQQMMEKQAKVTAKEASKNKKSGEAFLAENAKKEGVKTTPSGLQYKVLVEGTGKSPNSTDTVVVHYRGTLIDGTEFDSSHKRGEPATFPLNGVIKGWTEGLQLMKVGAKYEFYIPSDLAYGDRGAGQLIGPGATLIFEVALLDVK